MSPARVYGDWGTTRLRLWRTHDGIVDARLEGPGIGGLKQSPHDTLRTALAPWLAAERPARIVLCGMAGARNGLHEARYAECPASSDDWSRDRAELDFDGIPVVIAAGLASTGGDGADDVMRGEETQLFGALTLQPELRDGKRAVVLPGTHSKWVWLEDGRVTGLRTFLTGEAFALLAASSLFAAGGEPDAADEPSGFADGLARAQQAPGVLGALFEARTAQLRRGRSAGWAAGFVSGLLLGNEVAEVRSSGELPDDVLVIADPGLAVRYGQVLAAFGIEARHADGDACVLAGLELLDADG